MSHFTVLVIGQNAEKQLAPFHEFECTGRDDEFIQDIDETEETREAYQDGTSSRYKDSDGKLHNPYEDKFYRDPTPEEVANAGPLGLAGIGFGNGISYFSKDWGDGKGYRAKVRFVPEGMVEVDIPYKELMTFTEYVLKYEEKKPLKPGQKKTGKHKYGYAELNEQGEVVKVIKRTNPNSKWDWYALGGRWNGFLKLKSFVNSGNRLTDTEISYLAVKYGTTEKRIKDMAKIMNKNEDVFSEMNEYDKKNGYVPGGYHLQKEIQGLLMVRYENARTGEPGVGGGTPRIGYVDEANVGDIDFESMADEAGEEARERYERLEGLCGGTIPKLTVHWKDAVLRAENDEVSWDKMRDEYHAQPAKKKIEEIRKRAGLSKQDSDLIAWLDLEEYQCTKAEYIRNARDASFSTFAVIKDGKWYERGEMGWWGAVHDEKDKGQWNKQFASLVKGLPPETVISVYDCHI
jgi:hypothetical protein